MFDKKSGSKITYALSGLAASVRRWQEIWRNPARS